LSQGDSSSVNIKEGQRVASSEPVETDAIMKSLQITADNAAVATNEINQILTKINKGEGTLGRLIQDKTMAENIDQTILNLKKSTKGLDENMQAAQHNILLRGFFKKKEKAAAKAKKEAEEKSKKQNSKK
jgi:phospholipid/cholesterol/gamma-HCH transport system substrate-binding protein